MKFYKLIFSKSNFAIVGPGTREGHYNFVCISQQVTSDHVLYDFPISFFEELWSQDNSIKVGSQHYSYYVQH